MDPNPGVPMTLLVLWLYNLRANRDVPQLFTSFWLKVKGITADTKHSKTLRGTEVRDEQSDPGPGGTWTKFFFTRTSTKSFSEQDQEQNVFFGPRP
jgi:hypothetical protein